MTGFLAGEFVTWFLIQIIVSIDTNCLYFWCMDFNDVVKILDQNLTEEEFKVIRLEVQNFKPVNPISFKYYRKSENCFGVIADIGSYFDDLIEYLKTKSAMASRIREVLNASDHLSTPK